MKKAYKISLIFFACIGLSLACTKIETGYLSDYIKYRSPLLVINSSSYSISEALFTDGSTLPLEVELLEIRNKNTGAVATDLLTEHELNMWTAPYDYNTDTTEALVLEKLELKSVPAFEINEASGMVRFNPNTAYAEDTLYEFDLRISNVRGTKDFPGIGQVKFIPTRPVEHRSGTGIQVRPLDGSLGRVYNFYENTDDQYNGLSEILEINKISDEASPGIKVLLKVVDKNGTPFPPEAVQDSWLGSNLPGYGNMGASVRTEKTDTGWSYYFPTTPFPYYSWYSNRWFAYHTILPEYVGDIDFSVELGNDPVIENYVEGHTYWLSFRTNFKIYQPGTWEVIVKYPMITMADV